MSAGRRLGLAAGLGVALVPESVRALPLDGVVFRDLLQRHLVAGITAGAVTPSARYAKISMLDHW